MALTELTALPNEARPAGALATDVVAVGAVLAAADLSTLGAVETRRTTCGREHGVSCQLPTFTASAVLTEEIIQAV